MTKSHKILVFVPPFLIGFTVLMVFFLTQHNANQSAVATNPAQQSATTTDYTVSNPLPIRPTTTNAGSPQIESGDTPSSDFVACTLEAKQCPDGSFVGRTGPDCEFAACPEGASNYTACMPSDRLAEVCIQLYEPVCGLQEVQCVKEPCNPVPVTFSNSCFACMDETVIGYRSGACEYE